MKKAIFILPYFGKLPESFPLWLASCARNPGYDWLLFLDQKTDLPIPENVHVKYTTWAAFTQRVQACFDFPICLSHAKKLCDFKPACGMIFQEEIRDYLYWGFCDMDLVWGNLDHFLAKPISEGYEKILENGHCILMLNNEKMRNSFRTEVPGCLFWKDVFSTDQGMTFDEDAWPLDAPLKGLATIARKSGVKVWEAPDCFADVEIGRYTIKKLNRRDRNAAVRHSMYSVRNGSVFYIYEEPGGEIREEEQAYVHMQKRKWICSSSSTENFFILPPGKIVDYHPGWQKKLHSLSPEDVRIVLYGWKIFIMKRMKYTRHKIRKVFQLLTSPFASNNKNKSENEN